MVPISSSDRPEPTMHAQEVRRQSRGTGRQYHLLPSTEFRYHRRVTHRRLDIQGLRALAVLLVIANHMVGWPLGGFVGVDIFFVISGFLITGLLLREHGRFGRISMKNFYERRVKRILPVALVVTLATIIVAKFILSAGRFNTVVVDGVFASLFVANWHLIDVGTDYMHVDDSISPFQHYWSLSVEEQFYLLWPLLIIAAFAAARRSPRRTVTLLLGAITLASFAWSLWESAYQPTWAYFSTASRAWELGFGALLACAAGATAKIPLVARSLLLWAGLLTIGVAAFRLSGESAFPAPWALLPVVGTAAVIAAGAGGLPRFGALLANPVTAYIGELSFSLYLWHFPVLLFVAEILPARGERYALASLALTAILSVMTYHWIEMPLRRATWSFSGIRAAFSATAGKRSVLPALVVCAVAIGLFTSMSRVPVESSAAPVISVKQLLSDTPLSVRESERVDLIETALSASVWPTLDPAPEQLGSEYRAPEWISDGCLALESENDLTPEENAVRCVYGTPNAAKSAVLFGDSTAISYAPAVRAALGEDWRLQLYTMAQCPAVDVEVKLWSGEQAPECSDFRTWVFEQLRFDPPDVVLVTSSPGTLVRLASGSKDELAIEEWKAGTELLFKRVAASPVIALDPPPAMRSLRECAIPGSGPQDCISRPDKNYIDSGEAIRSVAARFENVTVASTLGWYCSESGYCPSYIGLTSTLADGSHLTAAASSKLAPLMREAIDEALR